MHKKNIENQEYLPFKLRRTYYGTSNLHRLKKEPIFSKASLERHGLII